MNVDDRFRDETRLLEERLEGINVADQLRRLHLRHSRQASKPRIAAGLSAAVGLAVAILVTANPISLWMTLLAWVIVVATVGPALWLAHSMGAATALWRRQQGRHEVQRRSWSQRRSRSQRQRFLLGIAAVIAGLATGTLASALQLVDSSHRAPNQLIRIRSAYALNTTMLPREPVMVAPGGWVEQPFEAPTEHLYVLSVMLSRDGGDPGVKSDWPTPVGRVTFQVRDGSQILVAISAVAMNNTPTSVMTNVGVQQGRMYKLRVINDDPTARLGMYLTVNERAPGAIVKTGPTSEARTYRQQLAATIRALY